MAVLLALPSAVRTAGGVQSLSVGPLTTMSVDVSVTATAGAGAVTIIVERQGADGVWYPVYTSAPLNAAGLTSTNIGPGCTLPFVLSGVMRFRWAMSGTSVTFSASVASR